MTIELTFEKTPDSDYGFDRIIKTLKIDGKQITTLAQSGELVQLFCHFHHQSLIETGKNTQAEQPIVKYQKSIPPGFVYVMKDTHRDVYKIGYSKQPKHRERTLQAEVPSIELIAQYTATRDDERQLHREFCAQRLRGEWFKLTQLDLAKIESFFVEKKL